MMSNELCPPVCKLHMVSVSSHTTVLSDDRILMADFQHALEPSLKDTKMPAGIRQEGTRIFVALITEETMKRVPRWYEVTHLEV
jgi:hypothetical protein